MNFAFKNNCPQEDILHFIKEWQSNSTYFKTKTSGSTGTPKTITIKKEYAIASAKATLQFLELKPNDKAIICLNPNTIGGKMMIVRALIHNLQALCVKPQLNPLLEIEGEYDFIAIAPIQLATLLDQNPEKLKNIKNIIVGGGIITEQYIQKLKELKLTVYQTFGMTETISHIALRKVGFNHQDHYHTLPAITVSQNKENQTLIIHAPQLGLPELSTNDVVDIQNETTFQWKGRADFTINTGGIKVQIEDLEKQIQTLITQPLFIWYQPHQQLGQEIIIIVEGPVLPEWKQKKFYNYLPPYHIPKKIANIEKFVRTPSDKIIRKSTFEQCIITNGLQSIL